MLDTPVLFLIFNRPETTKLVFERIRQAKPKYLFVAADGPRNGKKGEEDICTLTRQIATNVDWECELKTLFREKNLGCGLAPSTGITWFFEHVEQGIILEDDCLPEVSFFRFCDELLNKYKQDERIMIISGFNQLGYFNKVSTDYFFSSLAGIWGWATWRRAWDIYNFDVPQWKDETLRSKVLDRLPNDKICEDFAYHLNQVVSQNRKDFWDYQWWFYRELNNSLGIVPTLNLVTNIGFGNDATHTFDKTHILASLKSTELKFPLRHPLIISNNRVFEESIIKPNVQVQVGRLISLTVMLKKKLKSWIRKKK
jgi:hypothetical protein